MYYKYETEKMSFNSHDMEFGFESPTHQYFLATTAKFKRLLKNKFVKTYLHLTLGLISIAFSRYLIPSNIIQLNSENEIVAITNEATSTYSPMQWNLTIQKPIGTIKDFKVESNKAFFEKQKTQIRQLHDDMVQVINQNELTCLSSVYIGLNVNAIMLIEEQEHLMLFNPVITYIGSENITVEEQCIVSGNISIKKRAKDILIHYLNSTDFKIHEFEFTGFSSVCLQHHIDLLMNL